jgi:type III pantothenate kinase
MVYGLVDIGNTAIKVSLFYRETCRASYQVNKDVRSLGLIFGQMNVSYWVVASVVPEMNERIKAVASRPIVFIDHAHVSDLIISMPHPEKIGIDRLVKVFAAYKKWNANMIIVDMGTCITVDRLKKGGRYNGGVIAPGVAIMAAALHGGAAQLPVVTIPFDPPDFLGLSTESAMKSGLFYGVIHMVNGYIAQAKAMDKKISVVLTGGWSSIFASFIHHDVWEPDLLIYGLRLLNQRLSIDT